jgi:GAF domain-containing protein
MVVAAQRRPDDVADVLSELSGLALSEDGLDAALRRVLDLAIRTVHGCDAGGVTLLTDGRPTTAAFTDEKTLAIDRAQYDADSGPCLDAYRYQRVNRVDIAEAQERWPEFASAARAQGIESFLSAPLIVAGTSVGSLNFYSRSRHGFGVLDEAFVALFTGPVAAVIEGSRRFGEVRQLADQLSEAIRSRAGIEQAKGVLMARHGVDPDSAFALLREQSQRRNVKLRDLAAEVVASTARA